MERQRVFTPLGDKVQPWGEIKNRPKNDNAVGLYIHRYGRIQS
jgi:hypothetical protein